MSRTLQDISPQQPLAAIGILQIILTWSIQENLHDVVEWFDLSAAAFGAAGFTLPWNYLAYPSAMRIGVVYPPLIVCSMIGG